MVNLFHRFFMVKFEKLITPSKGTSIQFKDGKPLVPDNPIIPFIRGDGTGVDIWPATQMVIDAAVEQAYAGKKRSNGLSYMLEMRHAKCMALISTSQKIPSMP